MIIYAGAVINFSESLLIGSSLSRRGAAASLQIRVETKLQHELNFDVSALSEFAAALEEGDFAKVDTLERRTLVVVPRRRGELLLCIVESDAAGGDLVRMVHIGRRARRKLITGCEHARAAIGDRTLFGQAIDDARTARETVIV